MNEKPSLNELTAFIKIATLRSFRKAAEDLGLSASTLSHLMSTLERRIGMRLLHRTTRSVAPTEAGFRLLGRLQPLLNDIDHVLQEVSEQSAKPSGTLRINSSEHSTRFLL